MCGAASAVPLQRLDRVMFDKILSLGPNCEARINIRRIGAKRHNLRRRFSEQQAPSGPFDWQITPENCLLDYFRNDFRGMFEREDLIDKGGCVHNMRTGTVHPHEFELGPAPPDRIGRRYQAARERHDYLCEKLRQTLSDDSRTLFVMSRALSPAAEDELREEIARRKGDRFSLLSVDAPNLDSTEWRVNFPLWNDALSHVAVNRSPISLTLPEMPELRFQLRRFGRHVAKLRF
jgi:hypothetical protein